MTVYGRLRRMNRTRVVCFAFLAAYAVFSVDLKNDLRRSAASSHTSLAIRAPAPDFSLPDRDGNTVTLSEVVKKNKLVMINFWASWCGPCRLEMPQMEKVYRDKKKDGFEILAISIDDDRDKLASYLTKRPVSFPVLLDPRKEIAQKYGVSSYPTTVLLDKNGNVLVVLEGLQMHFRNLVEYNLREAAK